MKRHRSRNACEVRANNKGTNPSARRIRQQASNMAIGKAVLLEWSRVAANRRVQVTNELFPGGLAADSNDCTAEEVKDAVKNFRSHPTANQRFSLSANLTKKLVQLTSLVKDRIRLGQAVEFGDATTQAEFASMIDESQQREKTKGKGKRRTPKDWRG